MVPESAAVPPLAIANQYFDSRNKLSKSTRYRLILAKSSDFDWLLRDRHVLRELGAVAEDGQNHWVPLQELPFEEIILFAYAADHSSLPHMSASRQACIMRKLEGFWNEPGLTEK